MFGAQEQGACVGQVLISKKLESLLACLPIPFAPHSAQREWRGDGKLTPAVFVRSNTEWRRGECGSVERILGERRVRMRVRDEVVERVGEGGVDVGIVIVVAIGDWEGRVGVRVVGELLWLGGSIWGLGNVSFFF